MNLKCFEREPKGGITTCATKATGSFLLGHSQQEQYAQVRQQASVEKHLSRTAFHKLECAFQLPEEFVKVQIPMQ